MIADSVAFCRGARPRGDLRRRALLRRLQAQPRLRPADAPGGRGRRRGLDRPLRHQRRRAARGGRRGRRRRSRASVAVPIGIHTHNDGDLAVANTLAAVRHGATPGAGDDQRHRRALRQRRPVQRRRQPGPQVSGLRGPLAGQAGAPDRGLALRLRDGQHELPARASRSSAPARSPTRGGCTSTASARTRPATSTSTRRPSATSAGCWSASCRASRTSPRSWASTAWSRTASCWRSVLDRVQDLENEGYQFEAAEASFVLLVERLAGRHRPWFDGQGYHVSVSGKPGHAGPTSTEATVKLTVGDVARAHRQRGGRPGQRPRRRLAQGPGRPFPAAPGDEPGRLQGPRHQRPRRHRRAGPRRDREQGRRRTSGAPSASPRTSSRRAGWPWSTRSNTSWPRTRASRQVDALHDSAEAARAR